MPVNLLTAKERQQLLRRFGRLIKQLDKGRFELYDEKNTLLCRMELPNHAFSRDSPNYYRLNNPISGEVRVSGKAARYRVLTPRGRVVASGPVGEPRSGAEVILPDRHLTMIGDGTSNVTMSGCSLRLDIGLLENARNGKDFT